MADRKITVIRNGIDMSRVIERGSRPFATPPKLIIVARVIASKGHALLLDALAKVSEPWRLQVVGSGPEENALRMRAEKLNILSRIEWLGYRTDVPELLAGSDVFCFPSEWEGLGLAMLEAAAAGIPIVASDIPSLREVIDPAHAHFVPLKDVDAFAKAISAVLQNPAQALHRSQEIIPQMQERFSIDRMVVSYAAMYARLLGDRAPRP